MILFDDRGTGMRIVENSETRGRHLAIPDCQVAHSRLLLSALPHSQTTRLWLSSNSQPQLRTYPRQA